MGAILQMKSRRNDPSDTVPTPPMPPTDAALVDRARAGEALAREQLFQRHVRGAWTLALRLTGRRADAEDVVQDAFVIALDDLAQLRVGASFGAWLSTIVARQAHRHFRRRKLRRWLGLDQGADEAVFEALAAATATQEEIVELARIDETLRELDPRVRSAWVLRVVEGRTLDEVAEACGCSLATAKRRVAAAEEALAVAGHVATNDASRKDVSHGAK